MVIYLTLRFFYLVYHKTQFFVLWFSYSIGVLLGSLCSDVGLNITCMLMTHPLLKSILDTRSTCNCTPMTLLRLAYTIATPCYMTYLIITSIAFSIVANTRKYDHITPILQKLHCSPVKQCVPFKIY